jgi:dCMP deaminase
VTRPKWDVYFERLAYLAATRASCDRKHVGAVIASPDHRVVATGYNGAPAGMDSCDEVGHQMVEGHCVRTLHAESNAIDYAGRAAQGCTLYVTVTPCWDCAKRIINAGIMRVVYDEHYNSRYGKSQDVPEFLRQAGIEVVQMPEGLMKPFVEALKDVDAKLKDDACCLLSQNPGGEHSMDCKLGDLAQQATSASDDILKGQPH